MGDDWGRLREKDREMMEQLESAKFPDRYRDLMRQYFQND
jgi:hypothetical protein